MKESILLVGAGPMAIAYAKVLQAMNCSITVIGRDEKSAEQFQKEIGLPVITWGLESWLNKAPICPSKAIVCVGENLLGQVTRQLLRCGVKSILVEKPGGHNANDIRAVAKETDEYNACVYVGYNRRFYASTMKAQEIIREDGGITSFHFEFTEWGHIIEKIEKAEGVKEEWFLANSTHVIDLAFFLGGSPKKISCYTAGGTAWHPRASIYAGSGITKAGALFSYQANWEAPGRWAVEIMTPKHRLIFKPLERLQIQSIGSIAIEEVAISDELDKIYKPGIYNQVKCFLSNDKTFLPSIKEQVMALEFYESINTQVERGGED